MPCPVKRFIAKTTRGSKAMEKNTNELSADKVNDLKRLAIVVEQLKDVRNVGGDVLREIRANIAECLWHVMYDSIHNKEGGAK